MRAVAYVGNNTVDVVDVPAPEPGGVVVRVGQAGLCGTDLKIVRGDIAVSTPRVLGHEVVGHVAQGVAGFEEGARVLVDPFAACGRCAVCARDRQNLCPNGGLMGRDVDGGLTDLVAVAPQRLHRVPDTIDDAAASLLQVLGTCVHAQNRLPLLPGRSAVVVGLGVSGLLHVGLLRDRGVHPLIGVTRSARKRQLALAMGATIAVHPDDAAAAVADATDGAGADVVVECAGSASSLAQAIELTAMGGQLLLFGITSRADDLPLYQLYFKEMDLIGARAARSADYDLAIALVAAGRLDLSPLPTRAYALDDAAEAFRALADGESLKITVDVR